MHANFNGAFLPINASASAIYAIQGTGDPSNWKFRVKIVFLIGQTESNVTQMRIDEESDAANDLIQESFLDSYNNLTLKTVMMLKWVNDSCADKSTRSLVSECSYHGTTYVSSLVFNAFMHFQFNF